MATLNVNPSNDNSIYVINATFATAHGAASGTVRGSTDSYILTGLSGGNYQVERYFANFDTSALTAGATITAATLTVVCGVNCSSTGKHWALYSATNANPTVATDFPNTTTTILSDSVIDTPFTNGYSVVFTLNATGLAAMNKTGITRFAIRQVENDAGNTAPTDQPILMFSNGTAASNKPILSITYTTGNTNSGFFALMTA